MNKVIILAGGIGERMEKNLPKQYLKIKNKSILLRTINAFEKNINIDEIIVVIMKNHQRLFDEHIRKYLNPETKLKVVYGGEERYNSVYNGIKAMGEETNIVLIHDGVRPFVSQKEIEDVIEAAKLKKAALIAHPVTNTIKIAKCQRVISTPNRNSLYSALTPQAFDYKLIRSAYEEFMKDEEDKKNITDDTMVVERFGQEVYIVLGNKENIKITTPFDLIVGEAILDNRGEK